MRTYLAATVALTFFAIAAYAQTTKGKITGNINAGKGNATDNATVSLLKATDSSLIKATLPNKDGVFEFEDIAAGKYLVSASLVGYNKYISQAVTVNEHNTNVKLPEIMLTALANALNEVKVEAKKPFIERKMDRLIVNVESSIVSTGSTALEVLERSPGVLVNQEIGINLKGKSGVVIMLDGKPTPLSGADLITYLKSIPSGNIERIEIITNPSAKYDASGNAGIIDIRFKKDKRDGLIGSAGFSYGQGIYQKPSVNTSINYRKKQLNFFTTAAYTEPKSFTDFFIVRNFYKDGKGPLENVFTQNSFTRQPQHSTNFKTGVDYYTSKKTVIGVMFNGTFYSGTRDGVSNAVITKPDGSLQYTNQTLNLLNDKRSNIFGNLNFKHTFDSTGRELNADFDMGRFNARPLQDIFAKTMDDNNNPTDANDQNSDQRSIITVQSFKVDYVHPLKNKAKFEAGIKTNFVTTDNDVKFFNIVNGTSNLDETRSNHFIYKENVNAAYVNYAKEFSKTDVQFGLRLEHTHSKANQITTSQNFNRNYVQLFPSFFVNRRLSANHQLSLSYSRRIDRPTYRQLNPFKILVDNYTYVLGDPYLRPVLTHSVELNYTYQNRYTATFTYLQSKDDITDVFTQDDATKISSQIPANIQSFHQYDVTFNIPVSVKKWMNSNANVSVTYNKYNSPLQGAQLTNEFLTWSANVTNAFVLGKGWSAELSGFYQSKTPWGLFIIKNLAQVSSGIQRTSKNGKNVYKLAVADIFSTNHIAVVVKYQNMDFHTDRTWDSRFVTLSYTYRFGKNTVARARQRTTGVEDEKRRAN